MTNQEAQQLFVLGLGAMAEGNSLQAMVHFERASQVESDPLCNSYLGFCLARERGQIKKGIMLCRQAIEEEPERALHYLNLAKIQEIAGAKSEAIETLREGMAREPNQQIAEELQRLMPRKPPVIPFLSRNNPINKYLGLLLSRLKLR